MFEEYAAAIAIFWVKLSRVVKYDKKLLSITWISGAQYATFVDQVGTFS